MNLSEKGLEAAYAATSVSPWSKSGEQCEAFLTAYLQAAGSEEWQPIETAPKDGSKFLVWGLRFEWPEVVRFEEYPPDIAAELGREGCLRYAEGILADVAYVEEDLLTHWRPLPSPPQEPRHD